MAAPASGGGGCAQMATAPAALQRAVEQKLRAAFPDVEVLEIVDVSTGCGAQFQVVLVTPAFEGVPLIQRHREVNGALAEELVEQIHSLQLKTWTPAQYAKKQAAAAAATGGDDGDSKSS